MTLPSGLARLATYLFPTGSENIRENHRDGLSGLLGRQRGDHTSRGDQINSLLDQRLRRLRQQFGILTWPKLYSIWMVFPSM